MDISLVMQAPYLKLYICIVNVADEGTVSQILYIGPCSFSITFRKKYSKKYLKSYPFFLNRK